MIRLFLLTILPVFIISCSYNLGYRTRRLPGGYRSVAIPVFLNETQEVGVEGYFTNALIREFERSKVARIMDKGFAPVVIEGKINKAYLVDSSQTTGNSSNKNRDLRYLPRNTVLNTEYRVVIEIHLKLIKNSDKQVIWEQNFVNEKTFTAAQVSVPGINSVNPLYNQSAKHQNIKELAKETMRDAHDRLTERF